MSNLFRTETIELVDTDGNICAIINWPSWRYARCQQAFVFNTSIQSHVENAMLAMGYTSSDYTLCHEDYLQSSNERYHNKETCYFYNITEVHLVKNGSIVEELRIRMD